MHSKHFLYFKIVILVLALSLSLLVYKNASASCLYGPGTGSCSKGTCDGACCSGSCCEGSCGCTSNCTGKSCGSDGCGGSCGTCGTGYSCISGTCVPTAPPTTIPPVTTTPTTTTITTKPIGTTTTTKPISTTTTAPSPSNTCTVGGGACCSSGSTCPYGTSGGFCGSGQKCCENVCGCQFGATKDCTISGTCPGKQTCGNTGLWGSCIANDPCDSHCLVCADPSYACSGGNCVKVCNKCTTTAGCNECSSMENGYRCICSNPIAGGYLNCTGSSDLTCCPANQIVGGVCVVSGTCPPAGSSCGTNGQAPCICGCGAGLSSCPSIGGGNVCVVACAVNKYSCDSVNHQCYIDASGSYSSLSSCQSSCVSTLCSPNVTAACTINGCAGTKTCNSSGSAWGNCIDNSGDNCPATTCTYTVCECSGGNCQTVTKTGTTPCPANQSCKSCLAYNTCNSATGTCSVANSGSTLMTGSTCPSGCTSDAQCSSGATKNCSWSACSASELCNVPHTSTIPIGQICPTGCTSDANCIGSSKCGCNGTTRTCDASGIGANCSDILNCAFCEITTNKCGINPNGSMFCGTGVLGLAGTGGICTSVSDCGICKKR